MTGRASKERNGRSMVAKSKEIRGHGLAERSRSRSGRWSRQQPSCLTLSSYVYSSLLLTFLSMSPCTISCYIPTISASRTISHADSGNSPSTSFGTCGVSYGEHRRSLQTPLELVLTHRLSHLLVSRPSRSRALECFVMDFSHKSTHVAMLVCSSIVLMLV